VNFSSSLTEILALGRAPYPVPFGTGHSLRRGAPNGMGWPLRLPHQLLRLIRHDDANVRFTYSPWGVLLRLPRKNRAIDFFAVVKFRTAQICYGLSKWDII